MDLLTGQGFDLLQQLRQPLQSPLLAEQLFDLFQIVIVTAHTHRHGPCLRLLPSESALFVGDPLEVASGIGHRIIQNLMAKTLQHIAVGVIQILFCVHQGFTSFSGFFL